jgi:hypothetical protein
MDSHGSPGVAEHFAVQVGLKTTNVANIGNFEAVGITRVPA